MDEHMFDNSLHIKEDQSSNQFERDKAADEEFKSVSSLALKNEEMNLSQIQQFQLDKSVCQSSNSKKKIKIKSKKQSKAMNLVLEDQSSQTDSYKMQEQVQQQNNYLEEE